MAGPSSVREALIAELLGDMDNLIKRTEKLPANIQEVESRLRATMAALDDAGDRYRATVTTFTEDAKNDLGEYSDLYRQRWTAEIQSSMQEAARDAFRSEVAGKAGTMFESMSRTIRRLDQQPSLGRLDIFAMCTAASLLSSALTVAIVRFL